MLLVLVLRRQSLDGLTVINDGSFGGSGTFVGDGSFGGNLSVGGTITYEDVTNVDSVGLITARDGISVTGGGISVGSDITLSAGGNIFASGISTVGNVEDAKGNLRSIPQNSQSSAYTLVIADAGKHVSITTGGVTIPSGVFSTGDAITIVNNSASDQTITCSAVTTYLANDTSTKTSLTLKARGLATFLFVSATVVYGAGAGLE